MGGGKEDFKETKVKCVRAENGSEALFRIFSVIFSRLPNLCPRDISSVVPHIYHHKQNPQRGNPKTNNNFTKYFIKIVSSKKGLGLKQCNSSFLTFAYFAEYYIYRRETEVLKPKKCISFFYLCSLGLVALQSKCITLE